MIETDYLVVGAGALGLAFTDALLDAADDRLDVVLVDRRHAPGGHWNDAYPFVRLHQPSAYYGVDTVPLGDDRYDTDGPNAGSYERATGAEVCAYFARVLHERLVPSGHARFFGMSDYQGPAGGAHRFMSLLTGEVTEVRVRRRVVDATYLSSEVPSRHDPPFWIDPDARVVNVNDLVRTLDVADGFTVIGGGKTGMDACSWLLDQGVDPASIRWIRSRESWLLDRRFQQPLAHVPELIDGIARWVEAAAAAEDVPELFARVEACGQLVRLDPEVEPTMYRCATISHAEVDGLRTIGDVVRLGHVVGVGPDRVDLEQGSIRSTPGRINVDCTAAGITRRPPVPVFTPDRITIQCARMCQPTLHGAVTGHLEATRDDDVHKNELLPPNPYPDRATDWITNQLAAQRVEGIWTADAELSRWLQRSRLNVAHGLADHRDDPRMQQALTKLFTHAAAAEENLARLAGSFSP